MEDNLSFDIYDIDIISAVSRAIKKQRGFTNAATLYGSVPRVLRRTKGAQRLIRAANIGSDELIRANSVFPFVIFPDTIIVDREKLTIAHRIFFRVAKILSVPIEDILSVEADVGPFFGSLHVTSKYFVQNPQSMMYLKRKDAIKIQRLLQGYIIAHEKRIDCSDIDKSILCEMLIKLGQGVAD